MSIRFGKTILTAVFTVFCLTVFFGVHYAGAAANESSAASLVTAGAVSVQTTTPDVITAKGMTMLNLPPRLQWENGHGYCGETSIQTSALYYGTYISQNMARKLAGGELLISVNEYPVLKGLGLTYDEWNYDAKTPQYKAYLVWVKQHLNQGHPVILTVYVKGMTDPDFDHIIPAVGFSSQDMRKYSDSDNLAFNDNFAKTPFLRSFGSMQDTREMKGNGATEKYCIPRNVDYGCAVTGIVDVKHETVPVSLRINFWNEPNVSLKEKAKTLHGVITINSLRPGSKYLLLRYNNYKKLPKSGFAASKADKTVKFTADAKMMTFNDSIKSNTVAIYRCVLQK